MRDLLILAAFLFAAALALAARRHRRVAAEEALASPRGTALIEADGGASGLALGRAVSSRAFGFVWLLRSLPPTVTMLAAIALMLTGQLSLVRSDGAAAYLAYALGIALFASLALGAERKCERLPTAAASSGASAGRESQRALRGRQLWLIGAGLAAELFIWDQVRARPAGAGYLDVALLWVLAMVAVVIAARDWPLPGLGRWIQAIRSQLGWKEWAAFGLVTLVALCLRFIDLDHYPLVFGGDEASAALAAVGVLRGKITDPFGTVMVALSSFPALFSFLQALAMKWAGETVAGVRVVSAAVGALTVACTFLLARRLFGLPTGILSGVLLAVFPYHLFFSRLAIDNVVDGLVAVLVIHLLDRALAHGRRVDWLAAGMVVGFGQYSYFGARILPLVAACYVLWWAGRRLNSGRSGPTREWSKFGSSVVWLVLGALIVSAPLLAYYAGHPGLYTQRINQVSISSSGWLKAEMARSGKSALQLVAQQVQRSILLPFGTPAGLYFPGDRAFVGWPFAVLLAPGLTLATCQALRRPYLGLVATYWIATLGLGLTEDPTQPSRLIIVAPFMAIFMALTLASVWRIGSRLRWLPEGARSGVVACLGLAAAAWGLSYYFSSPVLGRGYGEGNGVVATELAYYARSLGPGATLYFLGPPRMSYAGWATLPFIASNARGIDVDKPWSVATPPPKLTGRTLFAALPERKAELRFVRQWFPNGQTLEFTWNGGPLFTGYVVD